MPDLTTIMSEVMLHSPCKRSVKAFKNHFYLNRVSIPDKTVIKLSQVLEICGIDAAFWFLRCFDYKDYCLLLADITEIRLSQNIDHGSLVYLASTELIKAIREYKNNNITKAGLSHMAVMSFGNVVEYCYLAAYCDSCNTIEPDDVFHNLPHRHVGVYPLLIDFIKS